MKLTCQGLAVSSVLYTFDIEQGSAVYSIKSDYVYNCAADPGYLDGIEGNGVRPLLAAGGEDASDRAGSISPGVDLKDIALSKVHPVKDNDLSALFHAQQPVSELFIDNQFAADLRFAPLPRGFARIGNRTADYTYWLQDDFQ
jgi:hypothetical protein